MKNVSLNNIVIGSGLMKSLSSFFDFSPYTSIHIITDTNVGPLFAKKLRQSIKHLLIYIHVFPAGEVHKNLDTVQTVYYDLANNKLDRKGLIVNLGGGVVTDLGGFVAATYLRGVDSINVPTSLEGMADASIGGKVGVNLDHWKNYIGAFHQPNHVIIDTDMLSTLSKRNFTAGFGEIIKHGLIADRQYFDFVTSKNPTDFSEDEMVTIIKRSCEIKAQIVGKDEKENGMRKLLNFGHTAGHAIESLSLEMQKPLLHGEAVAIGMIVASKISELTNMISVKDFQTIESSIKRAGLPSRIELPLSIDSFINQIRGDKKNLAGSTQWVLLNTIGKAIIDQEVDQTIVTKALVSVMN